MKAKFIWILLFGIIGAFIGRFWYQNLRGVRPAIAPTSGNIVELVEKQSANTTGFQLQLPNGFSISIFAKDLIAPRVLTFDINGVLLASIPSKGKVVALPDVNEDGTADEAITVVEGLNHPHGLAFDLNKLYIAESHQVTNYDYDTVTHKATGIHKLFDLPGGGNHVTRTIGFGPDKKLYTSVGSSCNACVEDDWQRAKILVSGIDGNDLKVFASGLRNSVFFTWHPKSGEMWATDMGRDLIGDNIPPEEVNIVREAKNYGWPYCWGNNVVDTILKGSAPEEACLRAEPPHISFQAHSAPLGLAFIPNNWPAQYRGDLLVAYHGSWNRTQPTGYKVARFDLDENGNSIGESDFLSGWLSSASGPSSALGRPVDLLFDSKGNLFISDDKAGVIYKIVIQK